MTGNGERFPAFQVARQVLTELSYADLFGSPCCVPCVRNSILKTAWPKLFCRCGKRSFKENIARKAESAGHKRQRPAWVVRSPPQAYRLSPDVIFKSNV